MRMLAIVAGLALFACSCRGFASSPSSFVYRTAGDDAETVSDKLTELIFHQLQASGSLAKGYPQQGHLVTEPDPSDPGTGRMSCAPGPADHVGDTRCVRLGDQEAFVRVQPVTRQSAAFFMYRVYVAPRSPSARVDPTKDFVAVDVFGLDSSSFWQTVDGTIRRAAVGLGATPFRP
jgi:hypothetical protein